MAAITKPNWLAALLSPSAKSVGAKPSRRIYEFTQKAHKRTGGPTAELKRVHQAYLENQRKSSVRAD